MTKNLLVEILLILCLGLLTAFLVNGVRPDGIPLVGDYSRYGTGAENLPQRTAAAAGKSAATPVTALRPPVVNSEGFVEPEKIQLAVARQLFDQGALFIDARTAAEFGAGHITNAKNLPYHHFHDMAQEAKAAAVGRLAADRNTLLVCYCSGGECDVSIDLAYDIARAGYDRVTIYLGGYAEWTAAGYPVTTANR